MNDGRLIIFEGIDGSGKGTVLKTMATMLAAQGHDVVCTREPGGLPVSERIRDLLKSEELTPLAAFHLMRAASVELHHGLILPALEMGKVILSDRCTWASAAAYQGSHLGMDFIVDSIFSDPADLPAPDLAIYLDVTVEESAKRRDARGEDEDNFANLASAKAIYDRLAQLGLLERVDATMSLDMVETRCAQLIQNVMEVPPSGSRRMLRKPTYVEASADMILGSYNLE